MGYKALLGIIDADYDVIRDYDEHALIAHLVEGYAADADVAHRALTEYGLLGDN